MYWGSNPVLSFHGYNGTNKKTKWGPPEMGTVLQIWPHYIWVDQQDHFPWPAGNAFPSAPQDTVGLLGLLEHISGSWTASCPQVLQVLLHWAAFWLVCPHYLCCTFSPRCKTTRHCICLFEFQTILLWPSFQPVEVPLKGFTALWSIDHLSHFWLFIQVTDE